MSNTFNVSAIVRAEKLTPAEKLSISGVIESVKYLLGLIEGARPSNSVEHRKAKDAAHAILVENPTPATVDAYKAALADYQNPDAMFRPVSELLNHLIDIELNKLIPIAKRLHGVVASAVKDPSRFGLAKVESIPDIAQRGEALTAFAADHAAAVSAFNSEAEYFDTNRYTHNWLAKHGFCEAIFD